MTRRAIDLNADLGEDPGAVAAGVDAALLDLVTSANVACGGHAGDDATMRETVRAAAARGVAVGAHPGYEDRARFGRVEVPLAPREVEDLVLEQVARLGRIARAAGVALAHVKPHGALYHAVARDEDLAEAVARGAGRWSRSLVLVGPAGAPALDVWRRLGFRALPEAFADRRYEPDGSLRARSKPGSLLEDPREAAVQAVRIARGEGVVAAGGTVRPIAAETICLHGDTPGAVAIARAVRAALGAAGVDVRAPDRGA